MAVLLVFSSTLWMVVPQAFAGSGGTADKGWLNQFIDAVPVETGLQDASDPGSLIVQPVVVAGTISVPTAGKRLLHITPHVDILHAPGCTGPGVWTLACMQGTAPSLVGQSAQPLGP